MCQSLEYDFKTTMKFNIILTLILANIISNFAQETYVHTRENFKKDKVDLDFQFRELENKFEHRIHNSERRLTRRYQEKMHKYVEGFKKNLDEVYDVNSNLREELVDSKEIIKNQAKDINVLQSQLLVHTSLIDELEKNQLLLQEKMNFVLKKLNFSEIISDHSSNNIDETMDNTVDYTNGLTYDDKFIPFNPIFPKDCEEVYLNGGMKESGFYYMMVEPDGAEKPFKACCKMADKAGWTVIQRRIDGTVDFFKKWEDYKHGFGNIEGEFWLGNEKIYQLTNQEDYMLRIEMEDWNGKFYHANYEHFKIGDENKKYMLHIHGYHGNAGDSLTPKWDGHNGQSFSTIDNDNDNRYYDNCAEHYNGAWWFNNCFEAHLNGIYYHKGSHNNYFVRNGIQWNTIHVHSSLKHVTMMIKPTVLHNEKFDSSLNSIL